MAYSLTNDAITIYIRNIGTMSKSTAYEYLTRLNNFKEFKANEYDNNLSADDIITKIKTGDEDSYELLNRYAAYLKNCNIAALTLKQRVVTIKNFLEYCDVDISPRKFKLKVKLPKTVLKNKEALSKEDITEIINSCANIR